ncbi:MAG: hypothetical protein ACOYN0_00810 [Phycisphaerales bacterium]
MHPTLLRITAVSLCAASVSASPQDAAWNWGGPPLSTAPITAAAPLAGLFAVADAVSDVVEMRDIRGTPVRTITRAQIQTLGTSLSLGSSLDGPSAMCFSDSGRLLFIAVRDDDNGATGDLVLRYDTHTDDLRVFATADFGNVSASQRPAIAYHRGRLFVSEPTRVRVLRANANDLAGSPLSTTALQGVRTFAIDRDNAALYAEAGGQLYRASALSSPLVFTAGPLTGPTDTMTWATHYGASPAGLFFVSSLSPTQIGFATPAQANATGAWAPATYASGTGFGSLAAACDGSMLIGSAAGARRMTDTADTRLGFEAFAQDEFNQQVAFARGLINPAGWVIDADVQLGWSRFHPATPDAAAWTVLMLLMSERVNADPAAHADIARILRRYADRAPDGVGPLRSADGIFWHWLNPTTGGDAGWGDGYATMSTMKIVLAADHAWQRYPNDPDIEASARAIICSIRNWDSYFTAGDARMALLSLSSGGPLVSSFSTGWHEGLMFAEQAGAFGGAIGDNAATRWTTRSNWSQASIVTGRPVTVSFGGGHLPAFITAYGAITSAAFRADPAWRTQVANLRLSSAAWTDDNAPKYYTVFSAGTTRSDWGGYNADSFSNHPGDLTTFTSLLALSLDATGARSAEVGAAYHAYRRGARQTFLGGASILYRRSRIDPAYQPDSAGLPDVTVGGLALGEFLMPGSLDAVIARPLRGCFCAADVNRDGAVDGDDVLDFFAPWDAGLAGGDFNGDGSIDGDDVVDFFGRWDAGC